jgi:hypothetical protein
MFNIDPQKLAAVQAATRNITGIITVDYKAHSVLLELNTKDENALKALPEILSSFSQGLGAQLQTFFAISGRIIEKNKSKA